jgi:hypothetical protein
VIEFNSVFSVPLCFNSDHEIGNLFRTRSLPDVEPDRSSSDPAAHPKGTRRSQTTGVPVELLAESPVGLLTEFRQGLWAF